VGGVRVPFLDLRAQDRVVGQAVRAAVSAVLDDQQCVLGPHLERFEGTMAGRYGVRHAIGVGSGTDALVLALSALGVGPGSVVLTTPFSFFATASAIARVGARPLFADIDPATFNLDSDAVAAAIEAAPMRPAGLLPVHLFGRVAPMDALETLAARHGLWILEDAAQAIGADTGRGYAGARGRAGCFSFYPTKNLGGIGDGGMVLTNDDALAAAIRRDRHQGQTAPYQHASLGTCSRLDAIQAAALGAKLPHLDGWNAGRQAVARMYEDGFTRLGLAGRPGAPLTLPAAAGAGHVFHAYVVRAKDRDGLVSHLATEGIGAQVYYRIPLHRQPPLRDLAVVPRPLVHAERAAAEVVALPIYPELGREQIESVVGTIARFYGVGA
jgi:dTDP-4-amino-4,6-dideoxygalactose transaminase